MARQMRKRVSAQKTGPELALCTALYMRVSTATQADDGFSLDAQRTRLEAQCVAQNWHVCPEHVYTDAGISGKSTARPEFQRMMEAARAGSIQRIVVLKLDRLARNVRDFLALVDELAELGCDLVMVEESFDTSTPHGKFALTLFSAMAELERSTITGRVMSGKREKAAQGGYNGSAMPLGYDYTGGRFVANKDAQTVRRVFSAFNAGASLSALADSLRADNVPTAQGGQWWPATVRNMLLNGGYAGIAQWCGVEAVDGVHDAIVTPEEYERAAVRLAALRPGPSR